MWKKVSGGITVRVKIRLHLVVDSRWALDLVLLGTLAVVLGVGDDYLRQACLMITAHG